MIKRSLPFLCDISSRKPDCLLSILSIWEPRADFYFTENNSTYSLHTLEMYRTKTLHTKFRDIALFLDSSSIWSLQLKKKISPLKPPILYDSFIKPTSLLASIPSGIFNESFCKALMFDSTLFPPLYSGPTVLRQIDRCLLLWLHCDKYCFLQLLENLLEISPVLCL